MNLFGSTRTLRALNVAAVGFALAACTAAALTHTLDMPGLATGPGTLLAGLTWAALMRSRHTLGRSKVRVGWLWSIPIAMANAGIACALFLALHDGPFVLGLLFGPTFGVVVWGPALVLTLCCFGIPIAWSQRLAERGLAGEERGEVVVGSISAVLAVVALVLSGAASGAPDWVGSPELVQGLFFTRACGVLGLAAGLGATVLAVLRERRRRAFVSQVEAGTVPGFRVDQSEEGRVLVRITELGAGYRVSDFTEELVALDDGGRATHARAAERVSTAR